MSTLIYYQLYIFLAAFYGGVVIGFMYDAYKIYRNILRIKKFVAVIQDLLFWTAVSVVAISVLMYSNDGDIRVYSFMGFILGALTYNLLLSKIIVKTINKILYVIKEIIYYMYNKIKRIFVFIFKFTMYPYKKVQKILSPLMLRMKRIINAPNWILKEIRKYSKTILKKK